MEQQSNGIGQNVIIVFPVLVSRHLLPYLRVLGPPSLRTFYGIVCRFCEFCKCDSLRDPANELVLMATTTLFASLKM